MPAIPVCTYCSKEIEEKEDIEVSENGMVKLVRPTKWLAVPHAPGESAHLECYEKNNRTDFRIT